MFHDGCATSPGCIRVYLEYLKGLFFFNIEENDSVILIFPYSLSYLEFMAKVPQRGAEAKSSHSDSGRVERTLAEIRESP